MPQALSFIIKTVNTCNLACNYCYLPLLRQIQLQVIPDEYIKRIIEGTVDLGIPNVQFVWHGGEPLLAGQDFYRRAIEMQQTIGKPWQKFSNVMQSNGVLINDQWIDFFKKHNFGIGISIDGNEGVHDANRCNVGGGGSHKVAVKSINKLKNCGCDGGICSVVTSTSLGQASKIVDFFSTLNVPEIDFLPCFPSEFNGLSNIYAVSANEYADFMIDAFDRWMENDQPNLQIRFFRDVMLLLLGGTSNFCKLSPQKCSDFLAVDYNGDVYPCDNFVGVQDWKLGTLANEDLATIVFGDYRRKFLRQMSTFSEECHSCEWLRLCWGGCTFHRFLAGSEIQDKTIYCEARKRIFAHIAATLEAEPITSRDCSLVSRGGDEAPIEAYLDVGHDCNSACYFCAANASSCQEAVTDAQLEALQGLHQRQNATSLVISGGEPTLQPRLLEIVHIAREVGYKQIQLQSNGRRLSQMSYLRQLVNEGVTEFGLSLHGPNADIHDKITGRSGSFKQTIRAIENIRLLFGANHPTAVNCVIVPENVEHLGQLASLLAQYGVGTIKFSYLHGIGRATELFLPGTWPSKSEIIPYVIDAIQTVERIGHPYTTLAIEAIPPCMLPGYEMYCSDPKIRPIWTIHNDGNVTIYNTASERAKRNACANCVWNPDCLGPWKQYPQAFGWEEFQPVLSKIALDLH